MALKIGNQLETRALVVTSPDANAYVEKVITRHVRVLPDGRIAAGALAAGN